MKQPIDRRTLHLLVQEKKINVYGLNAKGTKELLIGSYEFDDVRVYQVLSFDNEVEEFIFTSVQKRIDAAASKIVFRKRLTDNEEVLEIQEHYKQELETLEAILNQKREYYSLKFVLKNNEAGSMDNLF